MSTLCYQNVGELSPTRLTPMRYLETNYDMSPSISRINGKRYICPHNWMQTDSATFFAPSTFEVNVLGDKNRPCFKCAGWIGSWDGGRTPKPITQRLMWNENTPCPQGYSDSALDCGDEATQLKWGGYAVIPPPTLPPQPTALAHTPLPDLRGAGGQPTQRPIAEGLLIGTPYPPEGEIDAPLKRQASKEKDNVMKLMLALGLVVAVILITQNKGYARG